MLRTYSAIETFHINSSKLVPVYAFGHIENAHQSISNFVVTVATQPNRSFILQVRFGPHFGIVYTICTRRGGLVHMHINFLVVFPRLLFGRTLILNLVSGWSAMHREFMCAVLYIPMMVYRYGERRKSRRHNRSIRIKTMAN